VVVAAEIKNGQTAKGPFGIDAVVDSVGDADATHTAGKTVVGAPKSLKQIFSNGPHFEAIEKIEKDQGRAPLTFQTGTYHQGGS
jgi:hypothetical protein